MDGRRRRREDHRLHRLLRSTTRRSSSPTRSRRCTAPASPTRDIAVFYRTNAQTRALEEIFIRSALPYRVMGGTKFYERAEIKDAMAYLIAVANPLDELALRRILNTPQAGHRRRATETALASFAEQNASTFREAMRERRRRSASGPKVTGAIAHARRGARRGGRPCSPPSARASPPARPRCAEGLRRARLPARESGYIDALRASRDPQDEARAENVEELVAVRPATSTREQPRAHARRLPHPGVARRRRRRARRRVGHRLAHDPAHREGPRVRRRVPHRRRGGPAAAPDVGGRAGRPGRGAPPVLRRHHARAQAPLPLARDDAAPSSARSRWRCRAATCRRSPPSSSTGGSRPAMATRGAARSRARSTPARHGRRRAAPAARATATLERRSRPKSAATSRVGEPRHRHGARQRRPHARGRATASATTTSARAGSTQVTGEGAKRIAHVRFDTAGPKKLLIKIAPIEKL